MNSNRGFTLMEMVTVIAILAITGAIVIPNLIGWLPKYRLGSGARSVLTAFQKARMQAIKDNRTVAIQFVTGDRTYFIFRDDSNNYSFDNGEQLISQGSLPAGITIASASFGPKGATNHLTSRGWASFNGSVEVTDGSNTKRITIPQTGTARIE